MQLDPRSGHSETPSRAAPASSPPEKLLTIREAAHALGVHEWALRRAIKRGLIPAYTPFNTRRLVRLSEVVEAIDAARLGGEQ